MSLSPTVLLNTSPADSLIIKNGYVEPSLQDAEIEKAYQFEREGYFCRDSESAGLVFNKTVGLRDTWSQ